MPSLETLKMPVKQHEIPKFMIMKITDKMQKHSNIFHKANKTHFKHYNHGKSQNNGNNKCKNMSL